MGTYTTSSCGTARKNSHQYVLTPRSRPGWKLGTMWAPRWAARWMARSRASWKSSPCSMSGTPSERLAARGPAHALAVVAACGADDLRGQRAALGELVEVSQATANLERAHRRVVLVLEPAVGAQALAEQAPAVLGRGGEVAVHHLGSGFDVGQGGQQGGGVEAGVHAAAFFSVNSLRASRPRTVPMK